MVFDMSRRNSFEQLPLWAEQMKNKDESGECFTLVLANKDDLCSMVDNKEVEQLVHDSDFAGWARVSAADGRGLKDALDTLVRGMVEIEETKSYVIN